jgi:hypothetical protein
VCAAIVAVLAVSHDGLTLNEIVEELADRYAYWDVIEAFDVIYE